jgi:hypothetical protein
MIIFDLQHTFPASPKILVTIKVNGSKAPELRLYS